MLLGDEELKSMEKEGHIEKLVKCDEDCFISPIVISRKKDGSIKLTLDSKLVNNQNFKSKIPDAQYPRTVWLWSLIIMSGLVIAI